MCSRSREREPLVVASHLAGEGHFRSERFEVVAVECVGEFDYWAGVAAVWDSNRTIINLEHDCEATDEHIAALGECPHATCSWAYVTHWIATGQARDVIAAGTGDGQLAKTGYLQGGEEWADWSAIGLIKVTPEARTGPLRREPWQRLELAVEDAVKRPFHMHWQPPLAHHHW